jgi:hydrogenase maturation factor HypF (carbamoyltransferase family)
VDGELDAGRSSPPSSKNAGGGEDEAGIARAFHRGLPTGPCQAIAALAEENEAAAAVLSGGVFQNELLED